MAYERLQQLIAEKNWEQLTVLFSGMSNMEFRRSEMHVRRVILPSLDNDDLWETLSQLVKIKRQAFISGVLAVEAVVRRGGLNLECDGAKLLAQYLCDTHPASLQKVVNMLLPMMPDVHSAEKLLQVFCIKEARQRIASLLKWESPVSYYLLFRELQHCQDDLALLHNTSRYILKRDNDMAYNMVAIMKAYFSLNGLETQHSLRVEPFELSLLERGADMFFQILNGKRPKV